MRYLELNKPLPLLVQGNNEVRFDGKYSGENGARIKIEARTKGIPETLKVNRLRKK